jgi:hypothetical protein
MTMRTSNAGPRWTEVALLLMLRTERVLIAVVWIKLMSKAIAAGIDPFLEYSSPSWKIIHGGCDCAL